MGNPPLIVGLLINGVAYAAIFIVVALVIRRFTNAAVWRVFVVVSLFVAAGLYVVFALRAGESTFWVVAEVVGVAHDAHPETEDQQRVQQHLNDHRDHPQCDREAQPPFGPDDSRA